ncbi:uncharacterized protein Dsimw501_GD27097 [Drosophila simulans]|nr:uncharacterized protein Dsimw501_GD27097 [Drosophila simulans]
MIFHSVFFFYFFSQESSWIHQGTERDRGKLIPLRRIQQEEHEASTLRLPRSSPESVSVQLIQRNLNLKTDHDLKTDPNKWFSDRTSKATICVEVATQIVEVMKANGFVRGKAHHGRPQLRYSRTQQSRGNWGTRLGLPLTQLSTLRGPPQRGQPAYVQQRRHRINYQPHRTLTRLSRWGIKEVYTGSDHEVEIQVEIGTRPLDSRATTQPPKAYRQDTMRLEEFDGSLHYLTVDEVDCANAAADKMAARVEEAIPTWQIKTSGELRSVTQPKILAAARSLKTRRAPGSDRIPNKATKLLLSMHSKDNADLFNKSLSEGTDESARNDCYWPS